MCIYEKNNRNAPQKCRVSQEASVATVEKVNQQRTNKEQKQGLIMWGLWAIVSSPERNLPLLLKEISSPCRVMDVQGNDTIRPTF